jgi:L-fuculose-phosphate aldolase
MDCRQRLIEAGKQMLEKKLTVETWGNLSLRDPDTGLVYLTPSAMAYHTIEPEDVAVVDLEGNLISGRRKPTIEMGLHLQLYRTRPEINAVIHTHPVQSQVFAVLRRPIPPIIDEAAQVLGGTVPVAQYALPGTKELAENVGVAMKGRVRACLMANHGAVCVGESMEQAFKVCAVLEMTAEIYQRALMLGQPHVLSDELVDEMWDFANNRYGK